MAEPHKGCVAGTAVFLAPLRPRDISGMGIAQLWEVGHTGTGSPARVEGSAVARGINRDFAMSMHRHGCNYTNGLWTELEVCGIHEPAVQQAALVSPHSTVPSITTAGHQPHEPQ